MARVRVQDKSAQFMKVNDRQMDIALGRMAQDIQTIAKVRVPLKSGNLQDRIEKKRISARKHQVRVDEDYAGYQERGMRKDGSRVVRRYTTPGTGKDFLKGAGKQVAPRATSYFRQAASGAKV